MNKKVLLSFDNAEEVRDFIKNNESGLYSGKNVDGEEVIVTIEKGNGMDVKTLQNNGWWVIHEYDKMGYLLSESFEKNQKL